MFESISKRYALASVSAFGTQLSDDRSDWANELLDKHQQINQRFCFHCYLSFSINSQTVIVCNRKEPM